MTDFDLKAALVDVTAYGDSQKRRGTQSIMAEFARLSDKIDLAKAREDAARDLLADEVKRSVAAEAEITRLIGEIATSGRARVTDEMVARFKDAWERADRDGMEGSRVRIALNVALHDEGVPHEQV